ncbi:BQ2448_2513 [Microbotryum intermedium]|uniref:BQ2448_2513 protein n=1 Tax=Microbotryum intermedium TaxID=269621 RepID=A0A238FBW5_9BASI|nr:BQ2448_2513 [Microbotryum intermedium]
MSTSMISTSDYDCYVAIDGRRVPVYAASSCGGHLHGYVESIAGSAFTVHVLAKGRQLNRDDRAIALDVDGTRMAFQKAPRDCRTSANAPDRVVSFLGQRCSATSIKPFYFADLSLTDDDRRANADENTLRNLGTIALKFYRVRIEGINSTPRFATADTAVVHEKAKHRAHHQVKLGEARSATQKEHLRYTWIDKRNSPYLSISFSYLPREMLEARDLIPRNLTTLLEGSISSETPARSRAHPRSITPETSRHSASLRDVTASPSPPQPKSPSPQVKRPLSSPTTVWPAIENEHTSEIIDERQISPGQMLPPSIPTRTPMLPRSVNPDLPPRMRTPLRVRQLVQPRSEHLEPSVVLPMAPPVAPSTPLTSLKMENRNLEIELERLKQARLREELERMRSSMMGQENRLGASEVSNGDVDSMKRSSVKREREKDELGDDGRHSSVESSQQYPAMRSLKRRPFEVIIVE